jgi:outer membrane protein assembly complex protein YaeT
MNDRNEQVIDYSLAPGERHKLVKLEIAGNKYFDTDTIRERIFIHPATFIRFRRGRYSADFMKRDVNAIKALYTSNGFRKVSVSTRTEDDYDGKDNDVAVLIQIDEGPQTFVSSLTIEGIPTEQAEYVRTLLQCSEGQPYSDLNVATDQETVLNYYYNNGYPDAQFEATATEAGENRVALKFAIEEGARQYVRDVLISGLRSSDPELVRQRIRNLEPGDPLSQASIIESQRRLYDLGIFARVDTAVQNPDGNEDQKFVLYRFEEARKYSINVGLGAQIARIGKGSPTAFDSPVGSTGFSPRVSFGVSRSNFLGLGHVVTLQSRWSNIQKRVVLSYIAPQFKGKERLNLSLTSLYDRSLDIQTFNSRRAEAAVQLQQRLTKANTIQYRLAYRRVSTDSLKITPALVPLFAQPVQLGIASLSFIQDRRDDVTDPHRGIYNAIDGAFASNFFGSHTSFTRVLGRNATYHRIGRETVFARSLSMGVISKITRPELPISERFFAGGATSHRGFPENQAGPRDLLTGFPIGGKALLINSLELRYPLIGENIGGVIFHDAGNVYSTLNKVSFRWSQKNLQDFDYMVHAVGFGIRYRTPIGPLRVDLAYSMNPPRFRGLQGTTEQLLDPNLTGAQVVDQRIGHFQFHFSLGQSF